MSNPFEAMTSLNRLIHQPVRLAILTALSACQSADYLYLKRLTGLTSGNLSNHINKLEEAELVEVTKQFVGKRPNTQVQITNKGQTAIKNHWKQLEVLRNNARDWKP